MLRRLQLLVESRQSLHIIERYSKCNGNEVIRSAVYVCALFWSLHVPPFSPPILSFSRHNSKIFVLLFTHILEKSSNAQQLYYSPTKRITLLLATKEVKFTGL